MLYLWVEAGEITCTPSLPPWSNRDEFINKDTSYLPAQPGSRLGKIYVYTNNTWLNLHTN